MEIVLAVVAGLSVAFVTDRILRRRATRRERRERYVYVLRVLARLDYVRWLSHRDAERVLNAIEAVEESQGIVDLDREFEWLAEQLIVDQRWPPDVRVSSGSVAEATLKSAAGMKIKSMIERARDGVTNRMEQLERPFEKAHHVPYAESFEQSPAELPANPSVAEPPVDPPRTSYGYIGAPDSVVADEEFEVEAGLSAEVAPRVASDLLERPANSIGPYFIEVHVTAHGFRIRGGERWMRTLPVTAEEPYPTFKLHLTAAPQVEEVLHRSIKATYTIGGQTVGIAARPIAVRRDAAIVASGEKPEITSDFSVPVGETAPDLTLIIEKLGGERIGWRYHSPHKRIGKTPVPIEVELGDAKQFARNLVGDVHQELGQSTLFANLKGKGRRITWKIPVQVLNAIRKAGEVAAPRPPTIFILSEEPYVPWELAVLEPPLSPDAPPFLAAQATVGRWVLLPRHTTRRSAPPLQVQVGTMAVVAGEYKIPGYARLVGAEDESAQLQLPPFVARAVNANVEDVMLCIGGEPKADVLHFAMHGTYDTQMPQDGLITIDGRIIRADTIAGSDLPHGPFVFLNACQVGSSAAVLGDYSGMAAAFISVGAAGVIAPLWSIKDGVARDMAMSFYQKALVGGEKPAVILRDERRKFMQPDTAAASTYLAYLFFGHPELTLVQSERSQ